MNYYNRYPGDYARDTQDLSLAEHGAYALLLDYLYATEKNLPGNPVGCYRVAHAHTQEEKAAVDLVLSRFFILTDSGYTNERVRRELELALPRILAARENGRRGGRRPNQKPSGLPSGQPTGQAPQPPTTSKDRSAGADLGTDTESSGGTELGGKAVRAITAKQLQALGVSYPVAQEYLAMRRRKKAQLTPLALEGIRREADKAGMTLEVALRVCVERGWQGFKAEWVQEKAGYGSTKLDKQAAFFAEATGRNNTGEQSSERSRIIDITPDGADSGKVD